LLSRLVLYNRVLMRGWQRWWQRGAVRDGSCWWTQSGAFCLHLLLESLTESLELAALDEGIGGLLSVVLVDVKMLGARAVQKVIR
jgi:hypothetical protein